MVALAIVGAFIVGTIFGVFISAMSFAASQADREMEQ